MLTEAKQMEEVAVGNQEQKPLIEALETAVKQRIAGDTSWNVNNLLTQLEKQLHMSPEQMAQELQCYRTLTLNIFLLQYPEHH